MKNFNEIAGVESFGAGNCCDLPRGKQYYAFGLLKRRVTGVEEITAGLLTNVT